MVLSNKTKTELPPIKFMPTDPEFGHLSKAQAQAKWRKQRELDRRLQLEKVKIEEELNKDEKVETPVEEPETPEEDIPDMSDTIIKRRPGRPAKG